MAISHSSEAEQYMPLSQITTDGAKLKNECKVHIYTALIFMSLCPADVSKKLVSDANRNQQ